MEEKTALITAVHRERYGLLCAHQPLHGKLKTSIYRDGDEPYPTVGDFVTVQVNPDGDSLIVKTQPRRSFFSRQDPDKSRPREQAVAANFDYVFLMASLNQDFNLRRLERYLALAWDSGATPVILLTKADLAPDYPEKVCAAEGIAPGVAVHAVSALTGVGLGALEPYLAPGSTIVFLGSSGIGKSSLLNALAGEERMAVREIRADDDKGRHTTTHRQLIVLPCGAHIIDTPGMRELGLWNAGEGVDGVFGDIEALFGSCRFSDCCHQTEPGCAVRAALEDGRLDGARWESYQKLKREALFAEDKAAAMREKRDRLKAISRQLRKM